MAKDYKTNSNMEDNKINLGMFIISNSRDGSKEKGIIKVSMK